MKAGRPIRAHLVLVMGLLACTAAPPGDADTQPAGGETLATEQPVPPTSGARRDAAARVSRDVSLAVDGTRFSPGARLKLTIRSHTSDTLGFNPCNRVLERRRGSAWTTYTEANRICTMELWLLDPDGSREATTELPASIPAGTYRFVLLLSRQKTPPANAPANWGTVRAASGPFTVE